MVNREISSLVCFAVKEEAKPFLRRIAGRTGIETVISGMGPLNAGRAITEALQRVQPSRVFTCGFAGGLNPELEIGAVLFDTADRTLEEVLRAAGGRRGKIHCANRVVVTVAEKQQLRVATGADLVEMESGIIQSTCQDRAIACATVRVVSDRAQDPLPLDFNQLTRSDQSLNYGRLAWMLAKSPGRIPGLLRLQRNCAVAAERLAEVLLRAV